MLDVEKEYIYFVREEPGFLPRKKHPEEIWPVDENMIGTAQFVDDVWYYIKGVRYKVEAPGKLTKIIIVE